MDPNKIEKQQPEKQTSPIQPLQQQAPPYPKQPQQMVQKPTPVSPQAPGKIFDTKLIMIIVAIGLIMIAIIIYFLLQGETSTQEKTTTAEEGAKPQITSFQEPEQEKTEVEDLVITYQDEKLGDYSLFDFDLPEWKYLQEQNYSLEYYDKFPKVKTFKNRTGFIKGNVRVFELSNEESLDYKKLVISIESYREGIIPYQIYSLESFLMNNSDYDFSIDIQGTLPQLESVMEYSKTILPKKTIDGKDLKAYYITFTRFNKLIIIKMESFENITEELRNISVQVDNQIYYPIYIEENPFERALLKGDEKICEEIDLKTGEKSYFDCISNIAVSYDRPELCEQLPDRPVLNNKQDCLEAVEAQTV